MSWRSFPSSSFRLQFTHAIPPALLRFLIFPVYNWTALYGWPITHASSHSEFAHLFKFLPDVEGDIANFLEDTLEVEILTSGAGLLLSVVNWQFVSPTHNAPDITMRSETFFKHRIESCSLALFCLFIVGFIRQTYIEPTWLCRENGCVQLLNSWIILKTSICCRAPWESQWIWDAARKQNSVWLISPSHRQNVIVSCIIEVGLPGTRVYL